MKKHFLFVLLVGLIISCQNSPEKIDPVIPFEELGPEVTGIDFANELAYKPYLNIIEYLYYYNGGGVAVGDINNDGLEDLYFAANQLPDRLYLNLGNMQFKDISEQAGLSPLPNWSNGVSMEDINNDGYLDIYVSKVPLKGLFQNKKQSNLLYLNNGDETFTEVAEEYGLDFTGFSTQAAFLDYDQDGDLDMYLLNHAVHSVRSYGTTKKRSEKDSISGDRFYKNLLVEGEQRFIDVTDEVGIYNSPLGYGLAITTTDINNDGWMDLYIGNDFHENDYLYINNQDGTFKESFTQYLKHSSRFTMGVDVADLNNDGALDIFATDMMPYDAGIALKSGGEDANKVTKIKADFGFEPQYSRNHLFLKKPYGDYAEVGVFSQTHATDWSWSILIQDFDNDGKNDLYVSNGIVKRPNDLDYINYLSNSNYSNFVTTKQNEMKQELIDQMPTLEIPNLLFKNEGNLTFSSLEKAKVSQPSFTNGSAYSDLDNDGDLDLVLNNLNAPATILENKSSDSLGSLSIQLKAAVTTGAQIKVFQADGVQVKEAVSTRGFQSASTKQVHFGLGTKAVDSIQVRWPDTSIQTLVGPFDRRLSIEKENALPRFKQVKKSTDYNLSILPFKHEENTYLDYEREQLVPEKLSKEGPVVLIEDFNNDGIEDIYLGGARYQASKVYLGNTQGRYDVVDIKDFRVDQKFEDVDAAAADIDNDGDLDLYVVSGGNDFTEQDEHLMDRIYLNDGNGVFYRMKVFLPQTNGSSVAVHDFNQDGYVDFFVGARSIPGAYGLSPISFLIKNNGDGTMEPFWQGRLGMITDALWHNVDEDPALELVAVGDWMTPMILDQQEENGFKAAQLEGAASLFGFWKTIALADLNGDEQSDLVLGNIGENTKFFASEDTPIYLYLDDFDENEQLDPVIFYHFFDRYRPFNTKNDLQTQMPMIKKRFPNYAKFSEVENIEALTGRSEKDILEIKKVTTTSSMALIKGEKGYSAQKLPQEAQYSNIRDFYWQQERQQLFYVGNAQEYVTELGNATANPGGIIKVNPKGEQLFEHFSYLPLPVRFNMRSIKPLGENSFLLLTNNDYVYLLNEHQND
ncbi:MAG: VCBS repeat-containing protein [Flavobacteriaceae bacterium]